jgi:hypothetical protein
VLKRKEERPVIITFPYVNASMHMACARLEWLHLALAKATKKARMVGLGRRANRGHVRLNV